MNEIAYHPQSAKRVVKAAAAATLLLLVILGFGTNGCTRQNSGSGEVRIESEPPGAMLSINGREVGKTPYVMQQPSWGKYLLQASKDGFVPLDQTIEISERSSTDFSLKLQKVQGLVLFETVPPGAEVGVNGVFKGKTPLFSTDLPTGSYKVTFTLEGYDSREMELTVTDRIPKLCQMNMRSIFATIQIESKPPGAAVIIDGIHKGQTPCSVENVILGNHALKLLKDGYKDYTDEVKLAQTGTFPINITMDEKLAVMDVTSTPAEAKVTVNDEYKGRTPMQVEGLRDGKYTVVIEKPGYEKITRTVVISKTEDSKMDVTLERATGTLALNISPRGALVTVDSETKGISADGPLNLELPPGTYKVEISKAGHRTAAFSASIAIRKATTRDVSLNRIFVKDTVLLLKDNRVREGMVISRYPNGTVRVETAPGIFEEFTKDEIQSESPLKP